MEKRKETRGAKKGRPKPPGSGRKATGLKRDKALTLRFTGEELEYINEELKKIGGSKPAALLKLLNYKEMD